MSEKSIVLSITKWFKKNTDAWVMKIHGGGMQRAGVPDILVIWGGHVIFLEVKQPGKKPTKLQEVTMEQLKKAGAKVAVVTSVDDVVDHLTYTWSIYDLDDITNKHVFIGIDGQMYEEKD